MKTIQKRPVSRHNSLLNQLLDFPIMDYHGGTKVTPFSPSVNVLETNTHYVIQLLVPGFDKKDLTMEVEGEELHISSKKELLEVDEGIKYLRTGFVVENFSKQFKLPENVNIEQIEAKYVDGILTVNLPKQEPEATVKKQIAIF